MGGLAGERLVRLAARPGTARLRVVSIVGVLSGAITAGVCSGLGLPAVVIALVSVDAVLLTFAWGAGRMWVVRAGDVDEEVNRATRVLALAVSAGVAHVVSAPLWADPTGGWLSDYLTELSSSVSPGLALVVVGVTIGQVATANSLVRLVLSASGTLREAEDVPVKGGRWIGPAERLLLLLLVLAGEITAAGLVTAAKGVLRQESAKLAPDYVVLGTIVSLTIALVPGLIVRVL